MCFQVRLLSIFKCWEANGQCEHCGIPWVCAHFRVCKGAERPSISWARPALIIWRLKSSITYSVELDCETITWPAAKNGYLKKKISSSYRFKLLYKLPVTARSLESSYNVCIQRTATAKKHLAGQKDKVGEITKCTDSKLPQYAVKMEHVVKNRC